MRANSICAINRQAIDRQWLWSCQFRCLWGLFWQVRWQVFWYWDKCWEWKWVYWQYLGWGIFGNLHKPSSWTAPKWRNHLSKLLNRYKNGKGKQIHLKFRFAGLCLFLILYKKHWRLCQIIDILWRCLNQFVPFYFTILGHF